MGEEEQKATKGEELNAKSRQRQEDAFNAAEADARKAEGEVTEKAAGQQAEAQSKVTVTQEKAKKTREESEYGEITSKQKVVREEEKAKEGPQKAISESKTKLASEKQAKQATWGGKLKKEEVG